MKMGTHIFSGLEASGSMEKRMSNLADIEVISNSHISTITAGDCTKWQIHMLRVGLCIQHDCHKGIRNLHI